MDLQSLKNALKVLDKGEVFGIFPEGKRAVTDSLDEFEKGAAFLAIRSGAPGYTNLYTSGYVAPSPACNARGKAD